MSHHRSCKGPNWTDRETRCFLQLCSEKQIVKLINSKKYKQSDIFRPLVDEMQSMGFRKSVEQMKLKLKKLRAVYTACKGDSKKSTDTQKACPFFLELDELYKGRPVFNLQDLANICGVDISADSSTDVILQEDDDSPENEVEERNETPDASQCITMYEEEEQEEEEEETYASAKTPCNPNKAGRKSYNTTLADFGKDLLEQQNCMLNNLLEQQLQEQKSLLETSMREQQKWELKMMEREHEFQKQQNTAIMEMLATCIYTVSAPADKKPGKIKLVKVVQGSP